MCLGRFDKLSDRLPVDYAYWSEATKTNETAVHSATF